MVTLKILAEGQSQQARDNARGKLFEQLAADVLRRWGYRIDDITRVNYAGMEIDIEGKHIATGISLYAECKCYSNPVDSPKLQTFFGKYMSFWLDDRRIHGLFLALPGLNPSAKGFYNEKCRDRTDITVKLFQEPEVLDAIYNTHNLITPNQLHSLVQPDEGTPGDCVLLYTNLGFFWIQHVIPQGSALATSTIIFDSSGQRLSDGPSIARVSMLYDQIEGTLLLNTKTPAISFPAIEDVEQIVEVQKSSSCFEYQYPAAPEFFVGREEPLTQFDSFIDAVLDKTTTSRGVLFQANSGWGKSSIVLAAVNRLEEKGHFALAIDSRSASTPQFLLRVIDYTVKKFDSWQNLFSLFSRPTPLTGLNGALKTLVDMGDKLAGEKRILAIFFDQFETLFFQDTALRAIRDLLLCLCNASTNIVIGFAWKTDLVGVAGEFPYQTRDLIINSSKVLSLERFSLEETEALFYKLEVEIHSTLRADLKFLLSEFSRGYPWLLKRLCAHVKNQRDAGFSQAEITRRVLNVKELFEDDLSGLSTEEDHTLRAIAKHAPINILSVGEEYDTKIVQSLVDQRLLIKIGTKYDIYWDIFRDYLNTGQIPIEENYLLRVQLGGVIRVGNTLVANGGSLSQATLRKKLRLSDGSFFNIVRDMRIVDLITIDGQTISLSIDSKSTSHTFEDSLQRYLKDKLKKNRVVRVILGALVEKPRLSASQVATELAKACPYISAKSQTWLAYAKAMADWIDFADLAIFDRSTSTLNAYDPSKEIREPRRVAIRSRRGPTIPVIQYRPMEQVADRILTALLTKEPLDWSGITPTTRSKSLVTLSALHFIERQSDRIIVNKSLVEFASAVGDTKRQLFTEAAMRLPAFQAFLEILSQHTQARPTHEVLAEQFQKKISADWTKGTARVHVKILLDWARNAGLAPSVLATKRRTGRAGP